MDGTGGSFAEKTRELNNREKLTRELLESDS